MFNKSKSCFTIVELLVVVSVLAALISMLVPSLKRSAGQAQSLLCQNVLKQYVIADDIYAEDNAENYVVIRDQRWGFWWFHNDEFLSNLESTENDIRDDETLKCPMQENPSYNRFSYAPNWYNNSFWWDDLRNKSLVRSRVDDPSGKVMFTENTDWHANVWQINPNRWYTTGEVGSNTVAYRHFEGVNLAFADGHVEYRYQENVYFDGDGDKIRDLWQFDGSAFAD